jgi:hypothetical protein
VTDQELKDIRYLASVLKRVEWSGQDGSCPVCRRRKAYGMHPCSCVIRLGQKALARLLGESDVLPCDQPSAIIRDGAIRAVVAKACDCVEFSAAPGEGATLSLGIGGEVIVDFSGPLRHALKCTTCGKSWWTE